MIFKKLNVGSSNFSEENFSEVKKHVAVYFNDKLTDPASKYALTKLF
jgi:hypothetical protein